MDPKSDSSAQSEHARPNTVSSNLSESPSERKKDLRRAIIEFVVSHRGELEVLSSVRESVEQIANSEDEIRKQTARIGNLRTARGEFLRLNEDRLAREKELSSAKRSVDSLAPTLGTRAFQGVLEGQISTLTPFADRCELHNRIESLQAEIETIRESPGSALLEKCKLKSKQVLAYGKLKIEEAKVRSADARLGKYFLDRQEEQDLNCPATQEVLEKVAKERQAVLERAKAVNASADQMKDWVNQLDSGLGVSQVDGVSSFDEAIDGAWTSPRIVGAPGRV